MLCNKPRSVHHKINLLGVRKNMSINRYSETQDGSRFNFPCRNQQVNRGVHFSGCLGSIVFLPSIILRSFVVLFVFVLHNRWVSPISTPRKSQTNFLENPPWNDGRNRNHINAPARKSDKSSLLPCSCVCRFVLQYITSVTSLWLCLPSWLCTNQDPGPHPFLKSPRSIYQKKHDTEALWLNFYIRYSFFFY